MARIHLQRLRRRRRARRPARFVRLQNPAETLADADFFVRFRFSLQTVTLIVDLVRPFIERQTQRCRALSVQEQVLVALRFFATGAFYRVVGDTFGMSVATVARCVNSVSEALARVSHRYIHVPTGEAAAQTKRAFHDIAGFPNVLGVVDGTFIRIISPKENEDDFVNRKGFHSLNVQMMCDHQFKITNCTANWPGSAHDQRIFRNSHLCANFENGRYDGLLLGDSAYQCTRYMIPPYIITDTDSKVRFNKSLCRTRVLIEQTYGILKRRFACLGGCLRVAPSKAVQIVVACAVLHNIGIDNGDIVNFNIDNIGHEGEFDLVNVDGQRGDGMREHIRQSFFA